jgi:hypothetical protein
MMNGSVCSLVSKSGQPRSMLQQLFLVRSITMFIDFAVLNPSHI